MKDDHLGPGQNSGGDPVERIETGEAAWGFAGPGYYFWDETWGTAYGPYLTEGEARLCLAEYVRQL